MATLTSTGAVNLTSATNWNPSQIPATGDDLVIGAHTLTLDADMTLNTITFNHASSRLAFTGTTRTVQATNGWYITAVIGTTLTVTSISTGTTLTLTGKWNKTGSADAAFNLCSIAGGTLNLRTVGSDLSTLLYEVASTTGFRIASTFTSGTLNTIGRFYTLGGSSLAMVQMSGGTWNHSHSGVSTFGNTFAVLMSVSGLSYVYWTGDIYASLTGGGQPNIFQFNAGFSGLAEITSVITGDNGPSGGSIIRLNTGSPLITGIVRLIGVATMPNTSSIADAISVSSGTFEWKEQTAEIPAGRMCSILQNSSGSVSLVSLTVNNYGKLLLYKASSGTLAIDSDTSIFNYPLGMVLVRGNESLDDRVIHITNNTLSLPPVETVAAGEVYGYTGFEKTGTGLIVDPAIIAAASTASMTSVLTEYDIATTDDVLATLQPSPGSTAERSIEDDKPLTFSWPNSTDTVTGEVSIDNGSYVAVAGAISYLREENGKYYYTLAFNAADRPSEEGVARYKFSSNTHTMYGTLRTINRPSSISEVERTGGMLHSVKAIFDGIDKLIKWIRQ